MSEDEMRDWLGDAYPELSAHRRARLHRIADRIDDRFEGDTAELALSTATMLLLGDVTLRGLADRWRGATNDQRARETLADLTAAVVASSVTAPAWSIAVRARLDRGLVKRMLHA